MASSSSEWDCDAYGADGAEVGALCFRASELGARVCGGQAECRVFLFWERRRVFARIQDGAATGDPDMVALAAAFASPDELLGGRDGQ